MFKADHRVRRYLRATFHGATLVGLAMIGLVWAGIALHLDVEREKSHQAAVQNAGNLARAFEEHTVRTIKSIDRALLALRAAYEANPDSFDLSTQSAVYLGEQILQFAHVSPHGMLLDTTFRPQPGPTYLGDREHFEVHRDGNAKDELFISKPLVTRTTRLLSIQLTRRLRAPDGTFGGTLVASLDPSSLVKFYESIDVGQDGSIALIGLDGVLRASRGYKTTDLHRSFSGGRPFRGGPEYQAGVLLGKSRVDGVDRLASYRAIKDYPLYVVVGLAQHEVFGDYWRNRHNYWFAAGGLSFLILIVTGIGIRHRLRLDHTRKALHVSRRRAVAKARELELTLDHMSQGIMMIDGEGNVPVMNRQALSLLGLPEHFLRDGLKFEEIVDYQVAIGEFASCGDAFNRQAGGFARTRDPSGAFDVYERTRPDGTMLEVRNHALPTGGTVRTFTDVTERKRSEARIAHMARHDDLTGVANRRLFCEQMEQSLGRQRRYGEGFAILIIDLDHFKAVNDTMGHPTGDALLRAVTERLSTCVRETDLVARLGGDEFAVLRTMTASVEEAETLAERLICAVGEPYDLDGARVVVAASIGIALAPAHGGSVEELLRNADLALYRAKSEGRSGYCAFETGMLADTQARRRLEVDLRNAVASGGLHLHFQPIISIADNRIGSFEALIRWDHPERGAIPPCDFIPLAEENGLIVPIGEWVLRTACVEAAAWPCGIRVAVNLSPIQFRTGNLVEVVRAALAQSGLPPAQLELEITESVVLQESAENLATLRQLRELGVSIALDDFGTGYSSLSYLHTFPFDKIKIDRSFVAQLSTRPDCAAIVRSLGALAKSLGMATTAEGVETREQYEALRAAGYTEAQGYFFSPPKPAGAFAGKLADGGTALVGLPSLVKVA